MMRWTTRLQPLADASKRQAKLSALLAARFTQDREGVEGAKRARGERGSTWWKDVDDNRHLARRTPYAARLARKAPNKEAKWTEEAGFLNGARFAICVSNDACCRAKRTFRHAGTGTS